MLFSEFGQFRVNDNSAVRFVQILAEIMLMVILGTVKWREEFHLSQLDISRELRVSPSVVSDYESGRRKSPGVSVVKRYVDAMINLEILNGGKLLKRFDTETRFLSRGSVG